MFCFWADAWRWFVANFSRTRVSAPHDSALACCRTPMPVPKKRIAKTRVAKKTLGHSPKPSVNDDLRTYTIRDYRLEKPNFTLRQVRAGDGIRYEVESADLSAPVPPIRESKYLRREQCIEIYRWMRLNRR